MGKIFKYEWKKQMFSKYVIGGILLVLTLIFMLGTMLEREEWQATSLVLLVVAGAFTSMYIGVECLLVLNRDLRTKESHMLFMIPYPAYTILGAKILAAVCQILLTAALFVGAFFLCFSAYLAANSSFGQFFEILKRVLNEWVEIDITWNWMLLGIGQLIISWIGMIAAGFTAIIAVRTVFVQSKLATPLAIVLFFVLNWGMVKLVDLADRMIPVTASVAHAMRMERCGADAVVAEGCESGGHIGEITTMVLVPQVVDAVNIPVIAAGGIADGRGIAAAFMLGAKAVQMGTHFVATTECWAHQNYKDMILKAKDIDTKVTGRSTGHPVRALRNQMTKEYLKKEAEGVPFEELEQMTLGSLRRAVVDGDVKMGSVMAGQSAGLVKEQMSCQELIRKLVKETDALLKGTGIYE